MTQVEGRESGTPEGGRARMPKPRITEVSEAITQTHVMNNREAHQIMGEALGLWIVAAQRALALANTDEGQRRRIEELAAFDLDFQAEWA